MNKLTIYCDGGSRGNPGPAACAFVVYKNDQKFFSDSQFLGNQTNNIAEYQAVILALKWLLKNENKIETAVGFILDSQLVVRQLNGIYKIKNVSLKNLVEEIKNICSKLTKAKINFSHVSRKKNHEADFLVNQTLNRFTH